MKADVKIWVVSWQSTFNYRKSCDVTLQIVRYKQSKWKQWSVKIISCRSLQMKVLHKHWSGNDSRKERVEQLTNIFGFELIMFWTTSFQKMFPHPVKFRIKRLLNRAGLGLERTNIENLSVCLCLCAVSISLNFINFVPFLFVLKLL